MIEIELTYLARSIPKELSKFKHKEVLDIYLPRSAEHPILRIRKNGDKYEITKKSLISEDNASEQLEQTIPLTKEEFEVLAKLDGKKVRKIRYDYPCNGKTAEIAVFQDDLLGLVLIDVEFESAEDRDSFPIPDFCLADITEEEFAAGGMLAGKKYSDIEEELDKFGYKKLFL